MEIEERFFDEFNSIGFKTIMDIADGEFCILKYTEEGDFEIVYVNEKLIKKIGISLTDILTLHKKDVFGSVYCEDLEKIKRVYCDNAYDNAHFECRARMSCNNKNYSWVDIKAIVRKYSDGLYYYINYKDVSREVKAEKQLREIEDMYCIATENSDISLWIYDMKTKTVRNGQGMIRDYKSIYELRNEMEDIPEFFERNGFIRKDCINSFRDFYDSLYSGKKTIVGCFWLLKPGSNKWWCEQISYTVIYENNEPVYAVGIGKDITDYKIKEKCYNDEMKYLVNVQKKALVGKCRANVSKNTVDNYEGADNLIITDKSNIYTDLVNNITSLCYEQKMANDFKTNMSPEALVSNFRNGKSRYDIEYRRKMKDKSYCWVRTNIKAYEDPQSGDVMCFMYTYNINKEKITQIALDELVERNYDFVGIADNESGSLTCFSHSKNSDMPEGFNISYDKSMKEFADKIKNRFYSDEDYEVVHNLLTFENLSKELERKNIVEYTIKIWNENRSAVHTFLATYSYIDEHRNQILVCRSDITNAIIEERRQQELLKNALIRAEEGSKAKSSFLSRMSHEIRTPMNAIIGMSALAAQCLNDPVQVSDCISKIGISARFLLSLINDILDMNRIESGKVILKNEKIPFEEFINGINAICYEQAKAKNIDYDCIITSFLEDYYLGDAMKLQQIIINLLSNAIKFTPENGKVQFIINQETKTKNKARIKFTINDTGIGISEEFQKKMYEPFEQENSSTTTAYGGTGLGLAICKNLVHLMKGKISVNSIRDIGTEFVVEIPLELCEESKKRLLLSKDIPFEKLSTLIVDDEVLVCEQTKAILIEMGMKADWVDSGFKAVEKVNIKWKNQEFYDVILIDWKMPDMDGIETARRIRKIVGPDVTIIIITAYDWQSIEAEAKQAGVNMLISKPLFKASLTSTFQKIYTMQQENKKDYVPVEYNFHGKRVLLVEDHILNIEVAKRLLEAKGMEIEVAHNGLEAIEMFATAKVKYYDAILMDIRMPVMDGITAARSIRQMKKETAKKIPIIAMTANAYDDDVEKSRAAGMNEHLAKPIEPQRLYETLERFLHAN